MQLRTSSLRRMPGRYQEDLGPSRADRPLFAHPDVAFNEALVRHCAHPSLPLDHPGLGPSEAERARCAAAAAAAEAASLAEGSRDAGEGDESLGRAGGEVAEKSDQRNEEEDFGIEPGNEDESLDPLANQGASDQGSWEPLALAPTPPRRARPALVTKAPQRKLGQQSDENGAETVSSPLYNFVNHTLTCFLEPRHFQHAPARLGRPPRWHPVRHHLRHDPDGPPLRGHPTSRP